MDIAIAIIALPLRILFWIVKHPKLIILIVIIIGGIMAVNTCNNVFNKSSEAANTEPAKYQQIEPTVKQAPYVLWTQTRLYYVSKYSGEMPVVTLEIYYTYDKDSWTLQDQPLVIDENIYGDYRIYERKK